LCPVESGGIDTFLAKRTSQQKKRLLHGVIKAGLMRAPARRASELSSVCNITGEVIKSLDDAAVDANLREVHEGALQKSGKGLIPPAYPGGIEVFLHKRSSDAKRKLLEGFLDSQLQQDLARLPQAAPGYLGSPMGIAGHPSGYLMGSALYSPWLLYEDAEDAVTSEWAWDALEELGQHSIAGGIYDMTGCAGGNKEWVYAEMGELHGQEFNITSEELQHIWLAASTSWSSGGHGAERSNEKREFEVSGRSFVMEQTGTKGERWMRAVSGEWAAIVGWTEYTLLVAVRARMGDAGGMIQLITNMDAMAKYWNEEGY